MKCDEIEEFVQLWIDHSHTLVEFNPMMQNTSLGLGLIEHQLRYRILSILEMMENFSTDREFIYELSEFHTLSYLWVLGVYEIVRSIDEQIKKQGIIKDDNVKKEIFDTKISFERIRIPLAKYQPARRYKDTDWETIFTLGIVTENGVCWIINQNDTICRHHLSNEYLNLLMNLSTYFKREYSLYEGKIED